MSINYILSIKKEQFKNSKRDISKEATTFCIPCSETEECLGFKSFIRHLPLDIYQSEEDELMLIKREEIPGDCFLYELERNGEITILETGRPLALRANDIVRIMFSKSDLELYARNLPFFLTINKIISCKSDLFFHLEAIHRTFGGQDYGFTPIQSHLAHLVECLEERGGAMSERELDALLPNTSGSSSEQPFVQQMVARKSSSNESVARRFEPMEEAPAPSSPKPQQQSVRRQEIIEDDSPMPPAGNDEDLWANDSWGNPWN